MRYLKYQNKKYYPKKYSSFKEECKYSNPLSYYFQWEVIHQVSKCSETYIEFYRLYEEWDKILYMWRFFYFYSIHVCSNTGLYQQKKNISLREMRQYQTGLLNTWIPKNTELKWEFSPFRKNARIVNFKPNYVKHAPIHCSYLKSFP